MYLNCSNEWLKCFRFTSSVNCLNTSVLQSIVHVHSGILFGHGLAWLTWQHIFNMKESIDLRLLWFHLQCRYSLLSFVLFIYFFHSLPCSTVDTVQCQLMALRVRGGLFACLRFTLPFLADRDSGAAITFVKMTDREQVRGRNRAICSQRFASIRQTLASLTATHHSSTPS